ncbi:MAG: RNA methyltransferase [Planctomycetaceae bacterium]
MSPQVAAGAILGQSVCMQPYPQELFQHYLTFLTPARRRRIREVLSMRTRHLAVAMDGVFHPHNSSAVLRSCDAFGVQDVYLVEDPETERLSRKVAAGSDKWLTVHRFKGEGRTDRCVATLRSKGYRIAVTSPHAGTATPELLPIDEPLVLVIGNETKGVSPTFCAAADLTVHVPTVGFVESLNLSVAAALCLSCLSGRIQRSPIEWRIGAEDAEEIEFDWVRKSVRNAAELQRRWESDRAGQT